MTKREKSMKKVIVEALKIVEANSKLINEYLTYQINKGFYYAKSWNLDEAAHYLAQNESEEEYRELQDIGLACDDFRVVSFMDEFGLENPPDAHDWYDDILSVQDALEVISDYYSDVASDVLDANNFLELIADNE